MSYREELEQRMKRFALRVLRFVIEATELLAIVTSSNKTAKSRDKQPVRDSSRRSD